jgi:hypothetical protein
MRDASGRMRGKSVSLPQTWDRRSVISYGN